MNDRAPEAGRVALVTGAASGNGLSIATRFLERGDRVAAVDLDAEGLTRAKNSDWEPHSDRVLCLAADVAEPAATARMLEETRTELGPIDVLVNNAGITGGPQATTLHETSVDDFDRVWAVNVRALYLTCRQVLPAMVDRGGGVIVNIASVAGIVAFPGRSAYSISKAAVIQMTRSIAADYASQGIRCNALCPGMIETPMTKWRLDQPELRAQIVARIPQGEIGTPDDVAGAVLFLASPEARYFNGAALVMDGGYQVV